MEYKAQLVIRSREREGVELIDKIKELAGEEGTTFSETALNLLALGLQKSQEIDGVPVATGSPVAEPEKAAAKPSESAEEAAAEKTDATEEKKAEAKKTAPAAETKTVAAPDSAAASEAASPAAEVAEKCIAQVEAEEPQAAAQTLASFFGKVGPIQGGRVKNLLQAKLSETDYNFLMKNLRKTREYRSYRQRVIFER